MSQVATCTRCDKFSVPVPLDPIGVALMQAHLEQEHGLRPKVHIYSARPAYPLSETPADEGWWY